MQRAPVRRLHAVANFNRLDSSVITLMTPEPNGGYYATHGLEAFVRRFGYADRAGRPDRLNFGGIHRVNERHPTTHLTMQLQGYDPETAKFAPTGSVALVSDAGEVAASWGFPGLITHWTHKHKKAAYVPSICQQQPRRQYSYGPRVRLAMRTDFLRLLRSMAAGAVYYDPGIKVEHASTARPERTSCAPARTGTAPANNAKSESLIRGLGGASALDRSVWREFHGNLNEAVPASEQALRRLFGVGDGSSLEVLPKEGIQVRQGPPAGPTEVSGSAKLRRGQDYFREAVLNNFGGRCGVTQLGVRELLVASHILPGGTCPAQRLNVRNGLCLSRLHDAAFDRGLISFDDDLRLILSPKLRGELKQRTVGENFGAYEGQRLSIPNDGALPEAAFLAEHRTSVFQR